MAARAGVEPTTLRLRVIASSNAPPCLYVSCCVSVCAEASIPSEAIMHFSPVSDFPHNSKNFKTLEKFLNFPFSKNISGFFLVFDQIFRISPYFPCFSTFPPVSRKLLFHPPPLLCYRRNITLYNALIIVGLL